MNRYFLFGCNFNFSTGSGFGCVLIESKNFPSQQDIISEAVKISNSGNTSTGTAIQILSLVVISVYEFKNEEDFNTFKGKKP